MSVFATVAAWATVYSGVPGLGQQCVASRPLCLFGARLSSCSSTGACDFVHRYHVFRTRIVNLCPQLGCWLLSTAADDHCALATVGSGKLGTGFGGVLTPSPLPTCSGAPEIAGTTITFLCSTVCLFTVCASPAAASGRCPATGVHLMATTKLDSSRSDVGKRRIVRATTMPNIVPMRCVLLVRDRPNHKPYTHTASQLRRLERRILPHDPFSRKSSTGDSQGFFELSCIRRPSISGASVDMTQQPCRVSHHPGCDWQVTARCNSCSAQQVETQSCEPYIQRIVLLSRLLHLSPGCSRVKCVVSRMSVVRMRRE